MSIATLPFCLVRNPYQANIASIGGFSFRPLPFVAELSAGTYFARTFEDQHVWPRKL
jgi:hypothetical protein